MYIFNEFYTVFSFIRKFIFFENIILTSVIEWSELWETHKENLTRDKLYKERIRLYNCILNFNEDMFMFMLCLYFINETLLPFNRSLAKYKNMPQLAPNYNPNNTILNDNETNRYKPR